MKCRDKRKGGSERSRGEVRERSRGGGEGYGEVICCHGKREMKGEFAMETEVRA